jgi:hypothetical protein
MHINRETIKLLAHAFLRPFKGMPVPDFNNQYDSTIL